MYSGTTDSGPLVRPDRNRTAATEVVSGIRLLASRDVSRNPSPRQIVPAALARKLFGDPKFRELEPRGQLVAAIGGHSGSRLTPDDGPTDIP
jgi:hypothetical protein